MEPFSFFVLTGKISTDLTGNQLLIVARRRSPGRELTTRSSMKDHSKRIGTSTVLPVALSNLVI